MDDTPRFTSDLPGEMYREFVAFLTHYGINGDPFLEMPPEYVEGMFKGLWEALTRAVEPTAPSVTPEAPPEVTPIPVIEPRVPGHPDEYYTPKRLCPQQERDAGDGGRPR